LNERAGFGHLFPGRGALAGRKPDDRIADTARFAWLHLQIAGFAVALVEQRDGGDALRHWRSLACRSRLDRRRGGGAKRNLLWDGLLSAAKQLVAELHPGIDACPCERGDDDENGEDSPARHASGVHAS
tara:strand:- start:114539 stop:114925 length:387 start_codon:yes stop_codon:yes gene_type:complete